MPDAPILPYVPTLARLALALAVGLFVGIERERRRKEAGLRTFAFAGLLGATGSILGPTFALLVLVLVGILIVLLNLETIRTGEGAEITTSAALLTVALCGVLAGQGQMLIAGSLGVATAALLAWKEPLAGFSQTLTDAELRSAVMLAILAIVIYPVLPEGYVDPWHLVRPRAVWLAVLLVAGLGFFNYILLNIYGPHAIEVTGFLGGLVNSTATVAELAGRATQSNGAWQPGAFRGIVLASCAMLLRNALIGGVLAPMAVLLAMLPL
ncbi:MAG: MgtC/SapB family protein, partial [Candidatus Korobacteraceae bacterium]